MEVKKKMGRPTAEARTEQYRLRLSKKEMDNLNKLSEKLNLSKADVLREGLKKLEE